MDTIFFLTLLIIFIGALISNVLKWRKKDRVLKDLQNFHTTIEMQDGKRIWGETHVFANGLELIFSRQAQSKSGDPVASYIFYNDDIDQIRCVYRRHGELSIQDQQRRTQEILKVSNPGYLNRLIRKLRIGFSMFNDAIGEALNAFISRMKGVGGASIFSAQGDQIQKLGTTALSAVGNAYDPMLERYINRKVVVQLSDAIRRDSFCGFLKEYSSAWMSIVDCQMIDTHSIELDDIKRLTLQREMDIRYSLLESDGSISLKVEIAYFGKELLMLDQIKGDDYVYNIDKHLNFDESVVFTLSDLNQTPFEQFDHGLLPLEFEMVSEERRQANKPSKNPIYEHVLPDLCLEFTSVHQADVYVPRTLGVLRHVSD